METQRVRVLNGMYIRNTEVFVSRAEVFVHKLRCSWCEAFSVQKKMARPPRGFSDFRISTYEHNRTFSFLTIVFRCARLCKSSFCIQI